MKNDINDCIRGSGSVSLVLWMWVGAGLVERLDFALTAVQPHQINPVVTQKCSPPSLPLPRSHSLLLDLS